MMTTFKLQITLTATIEADSLEMAKRIATEATLYTDGVHAIEGELGEIELLAIKDISPTPTPTQG